LDFATEVGVVDPDAAGELARLRPQHYLLVFVLVQPRHGEAARVKLVVVSVTQPKAE